MDIKPYKIAKQDTYILNVVINNFEKRNNWRPAYFLFAFFEKKQLKVVRITQEKTPRKVAFSLFSLHIWFFFSTFAAVLYFGLLCAYAKDI